jgi:hypothetical protein
LQSGKHGFGRVRIREERPTRSGPDRTGFLLSHDAKTQTGNQIGPTERDDRARAHVLLFADDLPYSVLAKIPECLLGALQPAFAAARFARRGGWEIDEPLRAMANRLLASSAAAAFSRGKAADKPIEQCSAPLTVR